MFVVRFFTFAEAAPCRTLELFKPLIQSGSSVDKGDFHTASKFPLLPVGLSEPVWLFLLNLSRNSSLRTRVLICSRCFLKLLAMLLKALSCRSFLVLKSDKSMSLPKS